MVGGRCRRRGGRRRDIERQREGNGMKRNEGKMDEERRVRRRLYKNRHRRGDMKK